MLVSGIFSYEKYKDQEVKGEIHRQNILQNNWFLLKYKSVAKKVIKCLDIYYE